MADANQSRLCLWLIMLCKCWQITQATAVATTELVPKPGCKDRCGDVIVPYPFGIDDSRCGKNESFVLNCSSSTSNSPQLLFYNIPVLNVSVQDSTARVNIYVVSDCHDQSMNNTDTSIGLGRMPFTFSNTQNKLTAVGCNTVALMNDYGGTFGGGCVTVCSELQNFTNESPCSGMGCCQTPLPNHIKTLEILIQSLSDETSRPCSYAFLVDTSSNYLDLSDFHLSSTTPQNLRRPVLLDWAFSSDPDCEHACADNADCVYSDNAQGYICKCRPGFYIQNPYLSSGCQDIDECKDHENYTCHGTCKNTNGNYTCDCPFGLVGDGKQSCQLASFAKISAVVGSVIIVVVFILLIFIICKRRKKVRNFINNGGMMLKHQRVRIFSKAELEKATNNFDNAKLIGEGGFGFVFIGVLEGNLQIAVKKPKDENKMEISKDFHHEIATVSQVNHKNVVKLLGLCLETKVPLLVYEFISNGSLYQHIHDKKSTLLRSWKNRLRVATETAFALDYLHSLADPPIIHRDVKSMNILLDENHTAKVSDFGASVLISSGESALATNIQGTLGYLDPEYLMTGILTEKSDVYSFGVLLVELLTGEKPTSTERSGEKRNIIQYFISVAEDNNLFEILGFDVSDESEREEIEEVAELAKRCLQANGLRRPTMKEIVTDLDRLKKLNDNLWAQQNGSEETECLLGETSYYFGENAKVKVQINEQNSYSFSSLEIESSMPSI